MAPTDPAGGAGAMSCRVLYMFGQLAGAVVDELPELPEPAAGAVVDELPELPELAAGVVVAVEPDVSLVCA